LDAAMTPPGIFLSQANDQFANLIVDRWAAGPVRVGPLLLHQSAVPGQQGAWGDDAMRPMLAWQQPYQRREHGPIGPGRSWTTTLPTQYCHLMPQEKYLRILGGARAGEQSAPTE
jgi:hypothetical protein